MATNSIILLGIFCVNICTIYAWNNSNEYNLGDSLVVTTTSGRVRGASGGVTVDQRKNIYCFRGIPFAEPPVGNLRFQPPVAKQAWSGILDVSDPGPVCVQGTEAVRGSEDCLYLKVYTTQIPNRNNRLPVMVWIYGGAFFEGSPDFADHSPDYLLDQDVIIVSLHYRTGIFGFLSTGDTVAPGNLGLKDQIMALQWVKNNIENFGGDPNRITLFGQSAGAASIAYLLQSDKTAGLYNRVIMQSGSSLNPFSYASQTADFCRRVAGDLGVSTSNSQAMVTGLRGISAMALQQATTARYNTYIYQNSNPLHGLPIGPVTEPNHAGAVVTGLSHQNIETGNYNQVPIIIGHTSSEALLDSLGSIKPLLYLFDLQHSKLVPDSMNVPFLTAAVVGGTIKQHYFGSSSVASSDELIVNQFIHDDQFERGIQEAANLYAQRVTVYYYNFAYEGALYGKVDRPIPGVGHNEDLGYLFDFGYTGSANDYLTRSRMVKMWTNFAKTANPTPDNDQVLNRILWTNNAGKGSVRQLHIDTNIRMVDNPNGNNNFWANLFANRGRPPYNTY